MQKIYTNNVQKDYRKVFANFSGNDCMISDHLGTLYIVYTRGVL